MHTLNHARRLNFAQRSTVESLAHRSIAKMRFQTPPTVLPLTVGGGGSGMVIKKCAQIYGYHNDTHMDDLQEIPDPLDLSSFNGGGGGVQNEAFVPSRPHPNVSLIYCVTPLPL
jgi:hypothetical protein